MSQTAKIGLYQLENLLNNQVPFLFLDLRSAEAREKTVPDLRVLQNAVATRPDQVLELVKSKSLREFDPIVVICEDGMQSEAVAAVLESHKFINVYVFEGGVRGLSK